MASELSQLIDEELEKVERQQSDAEGKARQRKSFQIKVPFQTCARHAILPW